MNKDKPTNEKTDEKTENKVENTKVESTEKVAKTKETSQSEMLFATILKNPKVAILIGHILDGENPADAAKKTFEIKTPLLNISTEEVSSIIKSGSSDNDTLPTVAPRISSLLADSETNKAEIINLLAKGLNYETAIEKSYIKGRNEKIEAEELKSFNPTQHEDSQQHEGSNFLKNTRKSIWDY